MLHKIRTLLKRRASSYHNVTLWAMCCLAIFGFLRVSEFTIPTDGSYDLSSHLSLKDVAIDNRKEPRLLQLALKQSKTDTFKQGCKVYVGAIDNIICPIKAVILYLSKWTNQPGLLFITKDGKGWTAAMFRTALKSLLVKFKVDKNYYNTHSFLIRAATSTSLLNVLDSHMQLLGCWWSNAFQQYIKPRASQVLKDFGIW